MNKSENQSQRSYIFYLAIGLAISLFSGLLIPSVSVFYRIINGLFVGGLVVLFYGLFSYVSKVGLFDLFIYSHKKLFRHSKRNEDSGDNERKKLGSFHDYKLEKEEKQVRTKPILIGSLLVLISIILVFVDASF